MKPSGIRISRTFRWKRQRSQNWRSGETGWATAALLMAVPPRSGWPLPAPAAGFGWRAGRLPRLTSAAVACAVRLLQISRPLSTIMLSSRPKTNQISLIPDTAEIAGVQGTHGFGDELQGVRSLSRRVVSILPV